MNEGVSRHRKLNDLAVGETLWDIRVVAVKIADHGNRYRVTVTGRTSGKSFTREGFNPKIELLRILAGIGGNVVTGESCDDQRKMVEWLQTLRTSFADSEITTDQAIAYIIQCLRCGFVGDDNAEYDKGGKP